VTLPTATTVGATGGATTGGGGGGGPMVMGVYDMGLTGMMVSRSSSYSQYSSTTSTSSLTLPSRMQHVALLSTTAATIN
jgi:hypothetical protein